MHGGHVAPTAVAMHMQWGGARGSTFGVHMHVAPTVPTGVAAYACGFGVHMHVAPTAPTFWCAYACGSNGPNGLGCLCMWLQRRYMRRLGWYSYAVRSCDPDRLLVGDICAETISLGFCPFLTPPIPLTTRQPCQKIPDQRVPAAQR